MCSIYIHEVKKRVKPSIEKTAEQLVMSDLSDLSVLESISESLAEISGVLRNHFPRCSKAAMAAGNLLKESVHNNQGLPDHHLKAVEETVCSFQQLLNHDLKDYDIDFPDIIGIQFQTALKDHSEKDDFMSPAPGVDQEIMDLLDRSAVTFQAVMTKADKISKAELEKNIEQTRAALSKHPAAFPELIVTSSEKGLGIETLRATIATLE